MFEIVLKDGKVRKETLLSLGKLEDWLVEKIGKGRIQNILLAMVNGEGDLRLIFKK